MYPVPLIVPAILTLQAACWANPTSVQSCSATCASTPQKQASQVRLTVGSALLAWAGAAMPSQCRPPVSQQQLRVRKREQVASCHSSTQPRSLCNPELC
ncbi:hypothetical protein JKP88DRAFT_225752 [Tribonema minus]|uniref:Secreted protein n=1 Tax=Tribonema minus TaxID=303371 RepID=A0A835YP42_9STRA|nr:hypothetical protein JKP88DRAFT_225752 [Tribonema minus]